MLQLVYISTAREPIRVATCENILAASRANNLAAGVTGLLVAGERRFLQAIEGPTDAIRRTYARIAADPRHYACVILAERYLETPQFGQWAMGYCAGGDIARGATLEQVVAALVAPLDDPDLRAQFAGFAQLQSRAA